MLNEKFDFVFDLGMFDGQLNTQTTLLKDTGNDLSPEMKTFYDKNLIRLATPALVHDQFAQKRPIPKNGGKTIEFRKFDTLPKAMTPLTEGVTPDGNKLNVTSITATVNQYGDYITTSDILQLTSIDPVQTEVQRIIADQAGRTLDTVTRNVLMTGTNVMYVGDHTSRSEITSADTLKVKDLKKAVTILKRVNAQPVSGGFYVAIVHPDVEMDIMNDPDWISASEYAGSTQIFNGEIGRIAGIRFVESTEAKIFAKAGADGASVYATLLLGANAYGTTEITGGGLQYIAKQLGSAGSADPLDQRATMGWKAIKTAEILVQQYMLRIESAATLNGEEN